ncbi:hypothetical protein WJX82_000175 [Trebouxia sp. C0006]
MNAKAHTRKWTPTCTPSVFRHVLSAGEAEVDSAAAAAHAMLHPAPGVMSPGYPKPTPLPPRQLCSRLALARANGC